MGGADRPTIGRAATWPIPPLILVHGLLDTPAVFDALKRELAGRRQPLLIPSLPLRLGRTAIEEAAELLGGHIEAAFGREEVVDLLGFSMGGVIVRCWIQRLGGHRRTRRFLSVGSPQQGTLTAQPWPGRIFRGIADLKWDSSLLTSLNSDLSRLERIDCHSFYSAASQSAPKLRASRAMASPTVSSSCGFQLAPLAIGTGKVVAPPRSTTPRGPSTKCRPFSPSRGSAPAGQGRRWEASPRAIEAIPLQKGVLPASRLSFSATLSWASRACARAC